MKNGIPENRENYLRMLEAAQETVAVLREALMANVQRLQAGENPSPRDVRGTASDYAKAINQVIDIEAGLAKHGLQQGHTGERDLADARREILERLARHAGCGRDRGVSGRS